MIRATSGADATAMTKPSSAPFVATARRIHAAEYEARIEGERIVAAARREAEAIVARAHAEAAGVVAQARAEGANAGKLEALSLVAAARADEAHTIDRCVDVVVMASRAVAERALARALSIDDDALAGWAREALGSLRGARKIVVRGDAQSIERLRARVGEIAPAGCNVLELTPDANVPPGALVARSELGEVVVELSTQVAAFAEVLRQALVPAVRGARG